jgi:surface antigen
VDAKNIFKIIENSTMKKIFPALLTTILALNLSACATTTPLHYTQEQRAGFADTLATSQIDKSMDESDRMQLVTFIGSAKPKSINKWKNKKTGNKYEFISYGIYLNGQGQPCHTYKIKANTGLFSRYETTVETACRNTNGHWRIS